MIVRCSWMGSRTCSPRTECTSSVARATGWRRWIWRALRPEVILLDIHMPQLDGLAALRLIKAELPEIKIVMLTMSAEDTLSRSPRLISIPPDYRYVQALELRKIAGTEIAINAD